MADPNTVLGRLAVLETLVMAIFNECPNKGSILENFKAVSEGTSVHTLYSNLPESFYQAFEESRAIYVAILQDTLRLDDDAPSLDAHSTPA